MSAIETLVTDHLDLWSSAIKRRSTAGRGSSNKIELYGIKKLRELILELAVRGLLVPQDPNDEPASELLKKIAAEKARLVKEGKIKADKELTVLNEAGLPHSLPAGWAFERFGWLAIIERGGSPRPIQSYLTDSKDGFNWIKISDTDIGGKYITATREKITKDGLNKTRMVYPGDFLLTNSMSFGRPYITQIEGCIHDGWLRICPPKQLNKDFLYLLLSSPYIVRSFEESAAGAVVQNLNSEKVRETIILLPPIAEQHRIVAKVDELMALCDQLEKVSEANLSAHQTLVETLLDALTHVSDATEFKNAWKRLTEHFDSLFTTEESIDQLKQTILQLAVMGKLVPQDPNDEPASELLKKIAAEKARLVKGGKIKKEKELPPIRKSEQSFELPIGWSWARIENATLFSEYGISAKTFDTEDGIPVLKMGDIQDGRVILGNQKKAECDFDGIDQLMLENGDLLYNRTNSAELVGKTGIYNGPNNQYSFASYLIRIRCLGTVVAPAFLNAVMNSYSFRKTQIEPHLKQQCGQANVNGTIMKNMVVQIAPIKEQLKIMQKFDELMAICDQLKCRLSDAQTTQIHLADTMSEKALARA